MSSQAIGGRTTPTVWGVVVAEAVVAPEAAGRPLVVGVGASAGGLEAVQALLRGLSPGSGVAVVVVFHLDPAAKNLLPEVLAKCSLLPVVEVADGLPVAPDRVYTAPPHSSVSVRDGHFRLTTLDGPPACRTPIDRTLQALADDQRGWAAAVILSGAGSDGALGLKAVSDAGGVTFVQDPSTARHDGMPHSAITTGAADHVLPPDQLAGELVAYAAHLRTAGLDREVDLARRVEEALPSVCDVLLQARGHNFRHYKTSTLVRRVLRRMKVLRLGSARRYVERLRADAAEADQLFDDLLINVTAFFRDPEAFALLAAEVLPKLFADRTADQPVRVWCAGCATGEEAYTLAMLVREHFDTLTTPRPEVQIFATDIDEQALAVARQGAYPVGVAGEVGAERLKRFFVKKGQQYHVGKELRELVLFSVHNLINDPPFSRLDLFTCRNLLIYLGSHLQKKLIPLFHYALRPGGYLFLGPSENLSTHRELFRPVDAKHRISQRLPTAIHTPGLLPSRSAPLAPVRPPNAAPTADPDTYLLMQRIILDEFAPKAVVVNEDGQIVSASGNLEKYLTVSAGAFHNSLPRLAREGLRVGVRATLAEAAKVRRKVVNDGLSLRTDAGVQRVLLTVQPMPQMGEESGLFLVVFQDVGQPIAADTPERSPPTGDTVALVEQLERELAGTRDDLERAVQDLEAANEELKSGNEELLSMNEELQSANEELETSKEEVQAANDALLRVNTDLENLLASTGIATLFLDRHAHLRRVTPAASSVYRVRPDDAGRPLADFTHKAVAMPPLPPFEAVRDAVKTIEDEVELLDGSFLLRRVLAYRDRDGEAEGVVVTFTDVTERKRASEDQARLAAIVASSDDAIISKTLDGVIRSWNAGAERLLGYSAAEAVGQPMTLVIPTDRLDEERDILDRLRRGERVEHYETVRVTKAGRRVDISLTVSPVRDTDGRVIGASKVARDVSERKRTEAALQWAEDRAEFVRRASGVGFWYCDLPFDVLHWDERVKEHFWLPPDADVTIDAFYARLHPDDREPTRRAIERSISAHTGYDVLYRTVHPDGGEERWVRAIGRTAYAADGTPTRFDGVTLDVTATKRAEDALRESEGRFREFADTAPAMLWVTEPDGHCSFLSRGWLEFTGQTAEQGLGFGWLDAVHPDDRAGAERGFADANRRREPFALEHRLRRADGVYRWVIDAGRPRVTADGRALGYVGSVLDITERMEVEAAAAAADRLLRLITDNLPALIAYVDAGRRYQFVNRQYEAWFGMPSDAMEGSQLWDVVGREAYEHLRPQVDRALAGERFEYETFAPYPTGGRHVRISFVPRWDGERVVGYFSLITDIADRKRAEEALRASEERYRALVTATADVVYRMSPDWVEMFPLDGRSLVASSPEPIRDWLTRNVPAVEHARVREAIARAVAGKRMFELEHQIVRADGTLGWTYSRAVPILDRTGDIVEWFGMARDVTAAKQAEEALRASEERFRTLFETMDEGFCVAEIGETADGRTDYRIVEMNPAFERHTGLSGVVGRSIREAVPQLEEFWFDTYAGVARTGQPVRFEHPAEPLGRRWFDVYALRVGDPSAGRVAILFSDITVRKQAEQVLRENDRRKDEFLATLAHELRNPLAPLRNALAVLRLRGATDAKAAPLVAMMDRQLSQMVHLVDDLLDVSRVTTGKVVLKVERLDLRQVIDATLEACRPAVDAANHTLTVLLPDGPLPLDGDPTRLIQVYTNVLTNACKYTPPGGTITLSAERDETAVAVRVADSGMGIPADMLPRVFEMFTQVGRNLDRAQGGLGIGLSLVKKLVAMHGGTVTAESDGPNTGSTFTIRLPLAAAPRVTPPATPAEPAPAPVARRVLVVDDNRDAADSLALLLTLHGHDARTAHDGPTALSDARQFDPQVVFLDIGLPGMSGHEVAREFRADRHLARAVLVALTGWGSEEDKRRSREAGCDYHLIKPVDVTEVVNLLAKLPARE